MLLFSRSKLFSIAEALLHPLRFRISRCRLVILVMAAPGGALMPVALSHEVVKSFYCKMWRFFSSALIERGVFVRRSSFGEGGLELIAWLA